MRITRREWAIALAIAVVATGLMQLPYALGYATARPGTVYTGLLVNIEDASYYAIMLQGYQGAWTYHIQFTPEPHPAAFLYGFYLALGQLARVLQITIPAMWHAARIVSALLLLAVLFAFIAFFIDDGVQRRAAYLMAIFGSGVDWALFPWESWNTLNAAPVDFRMPEAHLFYAVLTYPHVTAGIALTLISFWLWVQMREGGSPWLAALAGAVNLAIGIIYPFLIFLIGGVLSVDWLYSTWQAKKILWQDMGRLVLAFLPALPLYVYYEYVLMTNTVFQLWDAQAVTRSPNPLHYVLAYGILLALAAPVLMGKVDYKPRLALLLIWVITAALLLYAPLNAQRRFVQGLQIPLSILASVGLFTFVLPRLEKTRVYAALLRRPGYTLSGMRTLLTVVLLLGSSAANLVILLRLAVLTTLDQPDALFRTHSEIQAADWLRDHAANGGVVLASYPTGSFIPTRTGSAVFVGQRYETSYFDQKLADVSSFFQPATGDAWRTALLERFQVRYVYAGPREHDLGDFDPGRASYLERVYSNSDVSIYRVRP